RAREEDDALLPGARWHLYGPRTAIVRHEFESRERRRGGFLAMLLVVVPFSVNASFAERITPYRIRRLVLLLTLHRDGVTTLPHLTLVGVNGEAFQLDHRALPVTGKCDVDFGERVYGVLPVFRCNPILQNQGWRLRPGDLVFRKRGRRHHTDGRQHQ